MTQRTGRNGRKGQTHTATPKLPSYDVPPASEVTVTRTDGSAEIVPARKPRVTQKQSPKRGPLICAMCGDPTTELPVLYSRARGTRGKPVHASCDPTATAPPAKRPPRQQDQAPPPLRVRLSPGADPATAWIELLCTQCSARPGQQCTIRYSDGSTAEAKTPHRERTLAAKKATAPR